MTGRQRPARWSPSGGLNFLADLVPGGESFVDAVNRHGVKVGQCQAAGFFVFHACVWEGSTVTDIDTTGRTFSSAQAINDERGIVGGAVFDEGFRGFVAFGGTMIALRPLPGDTATDATVINNRWTICGSSTFTPLPGGPPQPAFSRATCWDANLQPVDLNERIDAPGVTLAVVVALNNQGVLAVLGRLDGVPRLFLLHPQGHHVAER